MGFRGASGFSFGSLFLGGTLLLASIAHLRWNLVEQLGVFGLLLIFVFVPFGSLVAIVVGVLAMFRVHLWQFAMSVFGILGGVGALLCWAFIMLGA